MEGTVVNIYTVTNSTPMNFPHLQAHWKQTYGPAVELFTTE